MPLRLNNHQCTSCDPSAALRASAGAWLLVSRTAATRIQSNSVRRSSASLFLPMAITYRGQHTVRMRSSWQRLPAPLPSNPKKACSNTHSIGLLLAHLRGTTCQGQHHDASADTARGAGNDHNLCRRHCACLRAWLHCCRNRREYTWSGHTWPALNSPLDSAPCAMLK